MANLAAPTDTGGQLSIYAAPREILTSANAPENATAGEMSKFACPRCGADAVERFYGPCSPCRAELRGESPPKAERAPHRAPERPWRVLGAGAGGVAHLGELAERFAGVDSVWLTPPALAELGLPAELENPRGTRHELVELAVADGWGFALAALRPTTALWRGPVRVNVVVPSWDRGNPWRAAGAAELDAALERFWRLVGVPWGYSGAITSDALLRELTSRPRGLRVRPAVLPPPAVPSRRGERVNIETDWAWAREPLADELGAPFAIALDVNGAHLSAASSLALPAGAPEHHAGPTPINVKVPGLWQISPPSAGAWPDPFRPQPPGLGREPEPLVWVTTPTAALAAELGIVAHQAWCWPESHRYLDGWYKTLRDARTELMGSTSSADALALVAVKETYKRGIGRLGSDKRARPADDVLYQPMWRAHVIGSARARMWRKLRAASRPPFAIGTDCAWWFAHTDSPAELAAELGLELSGQLGKYKPAGVFAGDAARELVSAGEQVWRVLAALRELGAT